MLPGFYTTYAVGIDAGRITGFSASGRVEETLYFRYPGGNAARIAEKDRHSLAAAGEKRPLWREQPRRLRTSWYLQGQKSTAAPAGTRGGGTVMERCEQSSLLDPGLADRQHIAAKDILVDQVGHYVPGHKGTDHQLIAGHNRQRREAEVRQNE